MNELEYRKFEENLLKRKLMQTIGHVTFPCIVTLLIGFIVLRLTNEISWSWIWVISPLLIGWIVNILIYIVTWPMVKKHHNL